MAWTSDLIKVTLRYSFQNQRCQTTQHYRFGNEVSESITAAHVGEVWWNDVKAAWRAMIINDLSFQFTSVLVEELAVGGQFGEFAVPAGERQGTRALGSLGAWLPTFNAVGVRLVVASRATRPGQKRFPGLSEGDNDGGLVAAGFVSLVGAVAAKYSGIITLGAPALAEALIPVVARYVAGNPVPIVTQDVVGHSVSSVITSQVSRKPGRGI